jgi:putative OmpL-like beta-barrel porin-2
LKARSVGIALPFFAALLAGCAWGQGTPAASGDQTPPAAAPASAADATPPAPKPLYNVGKLNVDGLVDFYYSFNNNHPLGGFNQLYNFNDKTNQIDLNMAKLTLSVDPAPVGFRLDIGLGRVFDNVHPYGHPDPGFMRYSEQAYVSFKPKSMKGFEADFGQFVTSAGAEVIETKDNWNYSRSLLFSWAIPYYHFGIRTSMPIGDSGLTVGVQVVNGWNNIIDDTGKNMQTVGITGAYAKKKFTWFNNFYTGPNVNGLNRGHRNLYDTTLLLTPNDRVSAYVNFDYAQQQRIGPGTDKIGGIAAALRVQVTKRVAFSPRIEYFNDPNGYSTGTSQRLHEVTLTGEYRFADWLLSRAEYRHDGSSVPFFEHGNEPASRQSQNTVTIGFVLYK